MTMADHPWVDGLALAEMVAQTVERFGERDCLVFPHCSYRCSYNEFASRVEEVALALMALGVQKGEHVGIWATNWPQWVLTQAATDQMGAVVVNINPAYRAQELQYVLNQADITTLCLTDAVRNCSFFDILARVCPELSAGSPGPLHSAACPQLRHVISIKERKQPGILSWTEFCSRGTNVARADLARRQAETKVEDVVNIQYTSGTTGFPKGAMLTHRNLLLNAYYVGERIACTERDRVCIPVPFYHCFGCVLGTLLCATRGAAMVVPAESFDPLATLQAIQGEPATVLYGVPTMFIAELNHPRFAEFDLHSLRSGTMPRSPRPIGRT